MRFLLNSLHVIKLGKQDLGQMCKYNRHINQKLYQETHLSEPNKKCLAQGE